MQKNEYVWKYVITCKLQEHVGTEESTCTPTVPPLLRAGATFSFLIKE